MDLGKMTDEQLIELLREGKTEITDYLMEKYKDMVRKQARAMYLWGGENDDLIQEGMIGLFKAVQDYDPKEGASFSSFAGLCVSRQMYTAIKASQRKKHLPLNSYVSIYASASDNPEENGLSIVDTIEAGKESNPELMILGEEYTNAFEEELKEKLSKLERKVQNLWTKVRRRSTMPCSGSKRKHASFWKKSAGLKKSKNIVLKLLTSKAVICYIK